MNYFVTVFNEYYLPQGVECIRSLFRHNGEDDIVVVYSGDTFTANYLKREFHTGNIRVHLTNEVIDQELDVALKFRNISEYYWSLTPFTMRHALQTYSTNSSDTIIYVDADTQFQSALRSTIDKFHSSTRSVYITPHFFPSHCDTSYYSGAFCVQLVMLKQAGIGIIDWWCQKCTNWCYSHTEFRKFGDQYYLDDMAQMYNKEIMVEDSPWKVVGPWNANDFRAGVTVLYHFHGLRHLGKGFFSIGVYPIPRPMIRNLYYPYISNIRRTLENTSGTNLQRQSRLLEIALNAKALLIVILVVARDLLRRIPAFPLIDSERFKK